MDPRVIIKPLLCRSHRENGSNTVAYAYGEGLSISFAHWLYMHIKSA